MTALRRALTFMTTLPLRMEERMEAGELGRAAAWFPAIGLAMGATLWGLHWALGFLFPGAVVGALVVAAWVGFSGALHLDGFADCCDALFASARRERRLDILRDKSVGAFAAVGVSLLMILKTAAAASLGDARGLLLAPVLGRWVMLPAARGPAARTDGLGARLGKELTRRHMLPGLALTVLLSAVLGWRGLLAFVVVHGVALLWGGFARARLGGHSGDVLGAICELAEVTTLLAFCGGV